MLTLFFIGSLGYTPPYTCISWGILYMLECNVRMVQAAAPIMHCRNLNPYVASAVGDWSKSHMQNARVPRELAALPCRTPRHAAGVLLPHSVLCQWMSSREALLIVAPIYAVYE